jgi:hypothetical protein
LKVERFEFESFANLSAEGGAKLNTVFFSMRCILRIKRLTVFSAKNILRSKIKTVNLWQKNANLSAEGGAEKKYFLVLLKKQSHET